MKKKENLQSKKDSFLRYLKKYYWLYLFVLPALIWYVIFHYIPMGGVVIAFKRYSGVRGIWDSPWVEVPVIMLLKIHFFLFIWVYIWVQMVSKRTSK